MSPNSPSPGRRASALRIVADILDDRQNAALVAEIAAPVPGETGRGDVIASWESFLDEPAEFLRKLAAQEDAERSSSGGADQIDLVDHLAQKLHEVDPIDGHASAWRKLSVMDRNWYRRKAAALMPLVKRGQAEAWDGACEAFAWCITNGPVEDALPYVAQHNPYEEAPDEHR